MTRPKPVSPEQRRITNHKKFWDERIKACGQDVDAHLRVSIDRAKAAARRADRLADGGGQEAIKDLARVLAEWADLVEKATIKAEWTARRHPS